MIQETISLLHSIFIYIIVLFFILIQYENEVKIASKWTHRLSTRPHFSDGSGDVSIKLLSP